jgi:hypothetical protein
MADVGYSSVSNGVPSSLLTLGDLRDVSTSGMSSTVQSDVKNTCQEHVPANGVQVIPGVIGQRLGHIVRTPRASNALH